MFDDQRHLSEDEARPRPADGRAVARERDVLERSTARRALRCAA
jgi:membrane fusion protein (multidrug efflux system)